MTSLVFASESGVFVHGQYILLLLCKGMEDMKFVKCIIAIVIVIVIIVLSAIEMMLKVQSACVGEMYKRSY